MEGSSNVLMSSFRSSNESDILCQIRQKSDSFRNLRDLEHGRGGSQISRLKAARS